MNFQINMQIIKLSILITSASSLSACSFIYGESGLIKDTSNDYLKAEQSKELAIPPTLTHKNKVDYAQVPTIGSKAAASAMGKELQTLTPIQILDVLENVRVDKLSENPAVFLQEEKAFLWQSITAIFVENEIIPMRQDSEFYLIDTGWIAVDERGLWLGIEGADEIDEFRARYTIELKPSLIQGEVKLEVKRVSAQKFNDDTENWETVPTFRQDSIQMLNFLLANYDEKANERDRIKRKSLIAGFDVKLSLDAEKNPALTTAANIELVWDKLPKVLEAASFKVNDKDRRLMTYFLKYEKVEPGFFASLFSDDKEALNLENGEYQAVLTGLGQQTAITFKDGQGTPLEANVVAKLFPKLSKLFAERR